LTLISVIDILYQRYQGEKSGDKMLEVPNREPGRFQILQGMRHSSIRSW
jgi:hypothetical protein